MVPTSDLITAAIVDANKLVRHNEALIEYLQAQQNSTFMRILGELEQLQQEMEAVNSSLSDEHSNPEDEDESDMPQECWDFQSEVALSRCASEHIVSVADEKCSICHELFEISESTTMLIRCNHFFHRACISSWFSAGKTMECPLCKKSCDGDDS